MRRLPPAAHVLIAIAALLMAAPLAVLLLGSLHPPGRPLPVGVALLPVEPTLDAFRLAFTVEALGAQLARSGALAAVVVPLSVLCASLAAFAILELPDRTRRWAIGLALVLLVVPASALWVPRFVIFSELGVLDTYVPLVAPALFGTTPLAILLLHWSFRRIPRELLEAARLEGLGTFGTWRRVAEPLTRPTAYAVAALVLVAHWGDLTQPLLYLFDRDRWTLPLGVRSIYALGTGSGASVLAAAFVASVPPVLVIALAHRRLVRVARLATTPLPAVLLALVVLAGCGGSEGASGNRDDARPLTFNLSADAVESKVWTELAAAYEAKTGEEVQVAAIPDREALLQRLGTAFAARRPPDVFLLNHRYVGPFLREGLLAPVKAPGDLAEAPVKAFTVDGSLRCVPLNASSLVTYINLDRFEAAGVEPPSGAWTFTDLQAAARKLQAKAGEDEHAVGIEPSLIRAAPFVWSAGGEIVDDADTPVSFALGTPEARRGLEALVGLRKEGLTPTRTQEGSRGLADRFLAGQLGIYFDSRRETPAFREIEDFTWDVASFPALERPTSVLHSDGLCVAQAGAADRARKFVDFAAGPEGQKLLARTGRTVPSLLSIADSEDFLRPDAPPKSSQVWLDALPDLRSLPTTREFAIVEEEADLALEKAFYGEISIDAALKRLTERTDGRFG